MTLSRTQQENSLHHLSCVLDIMTSQCHVSYLPGAPWSTSTLDSGDVFSARTHDERHVAIVDWWKLDGPSIGLTWWPVRAGHPRSVLLYLAIIITLRQVCGERSCTSIQAFKKSGSVMGTAPKTVNGSVYRYWLNHSMIGYWSAWCTFTIRIHC